MGSIAMLGQLTATDATNAVSTLTGVANYAASSGLPIMLGLLGVFLVVGLVVKFVKRGKSA